VSKRNYESDYEEGTSQRRADFRFEFPTLSIPARPSRIDHSQLNLLLTAPGIDPKRACNMKRLPSGCQKQVAHWGINDTKSDGIQFCPVAGRYCQAQV